MRGHATALAVGISVLLVSGIAGCRANVPEGRFACTTAADCPPGYGCRESRCWLSVEADSGPWADAAQVDAAILDASARDAPVTADAPFDAARPDAFVTRDAGADAPSDAGTDAPFDAGPVLRRLRVLNAVADDRGAAIADVGVTVGGSTQRLTFGCTATFADLREGVTRIDLEIGGTTTPLDVLIDADALVVLGRTPGGSIAPFVAQDVVPASVGPATATLRYLNLVRSTAEGGPRELSLVTDLGMLGGTPAPFGRWSADAPATGDAGAGLTYSYFFIPRLLATFTFPAARDGLVVLTGDGDRHPATRGGPRAIVVPLVGDACATPVLPDPQITAVNLPRDRGEFGGGPQVFFCQHDLGLGGIAVDAVSVSGTTTNFLGHSTFGLASTATDSCTAAARILDVDALGARPGHRYLAVISGLVRGRVPADWTVTFLEDPAPDEVTVAGDPYLAGLRFVHLAPVVAPMPLDVLDAMSGTVVAGPVPVSGSAITRAPVAEIGTRPIELRLVGSSTTLARYPAAGAIALPGGAFVVFPDVDYFAATEIRQDVIYTPYTRPWYLDSRRPM